MGTYQQPQSVVHYVANIDIQRVERVPDSESRQGYKNRRTEDVTRIVVKADNINDLIYKVSKHLEVEVDLSDDGPKAKGAVDIEDAAR